MSNNILNLFFVASSFFKKRSKQFIIHLVIFSLLFATKSFAASTDLFQFINPVNEVNVTQYLKSVAWGSLSVPVSIICDSDKTVHNTVYKDGSVPTDCSNPMFKNQLASNDGPTGGMGLASITSLMVGSQLQDPSVPNDMALFIDDTIGDTIFATTSYAQVDNLSRNDDAFFKIITFTSWKTVRNIALALLGVLLAFGAFGIMFRQKLSPQAMITISSILPYVPIALIGIVLSYPIVTVFMNFQEVMRDIMWGLGNTIHEDITTGVGGTGFATGAIGISIPLIISMIIGGVFAASAGAAIAPVFVIFAIIIASLALVQFIRYLVEIAKTYVSWIMLTLSFPIVAAASVLPGKQGLIPLMFKKLIVNTLVIPFILFFFLVGTAIMLTMFVASPSSGGAWDFLGIPDMLFTYVKFFIGYGILNFGLGSRGFLESALGAKGSILDAIKPPEKR